MGTATAALERARPEVSNDVGADAPSCFPLTAPILGVVAVLVGVGATLRLPGLTSGDLWFDDAWAALPARVNTSTAIHMVVTTPLYSMLLRSYLELHPHSASWAQLPAFAFGLIGIVAVFALVRYFGFGPMASTLAALLIATSPVTITYSTRVKEYGFDLVASCALLWLAERWRRTPTGERALACSAAASVGVLASASLAAVVVPVLLMALWSAMAEPARRAQAGWVLGGVVSVLLAEYLLWLQRLPVTLAEYWSNLGTLVGPKGSQPPIVLFTSMFSGLSTGLTGIVGAGSLDTAARGSLAELQAMVTALVLAVLIGVVLLPALRRWRELPGPWVVAALVPCTMVVGALLGLTPLGGGRTDELAYPALVLLLAHGISLLRGMAGQRAAVLIWAMTGVLGLWLLGVGVTHRAAYPALKVQPVAGELMATEGTIPIVVDPWVAWSWTWADASPMQLSTSHTWVPYAQGFHPVSLSSSIYVSPNYFLSSKPILKISEHHHLLWYVSVTLGALWPTAPQQVRNHLVHSEIWLSLERHGWQPNGRLLRQNGVYAAQLVYHEPPMGTSP